VQLPEAPRGAVELTGVTKAFGDAVAVDNLDLFVRPGEFISLLGPSGCGKTTTLRILAGLEQADAGVVTISGHRVDGVPPHRRDVNTVFQAYALFPHMTVAENVAYGLRQRRIPKAELSSRVADALDMVKMTRMAGRRPRQLSGGQQQRVALARALVNRPSVLLLDEPLAALDRQLREEMQIELKLLQTRLATTFVFVTHDQGEALSMSDRIAVMLDGRIEQLGEPDAIYDEPVSAFVAGFIGQQNFFAGTAGEGGRVVSGDGWTIRSERAPAGSGVPAGERALAAVRPEFVEVHDEERPGAENVVAGELAGISHLGDVLQYLVVTPAGNEVIARRPRATAARIAQGTRVWCSWSPADVHVFPDDDRSQAAAAVPELATS
jgi:spermidine/putrescine transport system ATP-binding protein